jgi:hypothetical protein
MSNHTTWAVAVALSLITSCGHAQSNTARYKVVRLTTKQDFYLNGGVRSNFGGKSRTVYQIDLPANTVKWYYAVSTHVQNQNANQEIKLFEQITRLFDPSGITAIALGVIATPTGSNDCDIYLIDRNNLNAFYQKQPFTYTIDGSRENFRNGVVMVNEPVSGTYFLGFRNPSEVSGIGIYFEAVAIVKEQD